MIQCCRSRIHRQRTMRFILSQFSSYLSYESNQSYLSLTSFFLLVAPQSVLYPTELSYYISYELPTDNRKRQRKQHRRERQCNKSFRLRLHPLDPRLNPSRLPNCEWIHNRIQRESRFQRWIERCNNRLEREKERSRGGRGDDAKIGEPIRVRSLVVIHVAAVL